MAGAADEAPTGGRPCVWAHREARATIRITRAISTHTKCYHPLCSNTRVFVLQGSSDARDGGGGLKLVAAPILAIERSELLRTCIRADALQTSWSPCGGSFLRAAQLEALGKAQYLKLIPALFQPAWNSRALGVDTGAPSWRGPVAWAAADLHASAQSWDQDAPQAGEAV